MKNRKVIFLGGIDDEIDFLLSFWYEDFEVSK